MYQDWMDEVPLDVNSNNKDNNKLKKEIVLKTTCFFQSYFFGL